MRINYILIILTLPFAQIITGLIRHLIELADVKFTLTSSILTAVLLFTSYQLHW